MSFKGDIKKFNKNTQRAITRTFRGTALSMFSRVIARTPVDTGRLRGNWQTQVNSVAAGQLDATDKSGTAAIANASKAVAGAKIGDSIVMVNNLPYAEVIENGRSDHPPTGSDQAPQGMVKVTVAEFMAFVKKSVRRNR